MNKVIKKLTTLIRLDGLIKDDEDVLRHLEAWSDLQLKILSAITGLPKRCMIHATMNSDEYLKFQSSMKDMYDFFFERLDQRSKSIKKVYKKELI